MPYYSGTAGSIAKHVQTLLCGGPTHKTSCVCVFPDAGDAVKELEVAEALLDMGWNVTKVWLMTRDTLPSTIMRLSGRCTVETFHGYNELTIALRSIMSMTSSGAPKEVLVPGIHQMHVSYTSQEILDICNYFATCHALHHQGFLKHGYINFVSIPQYFPIRTTPPWMNDLVIEEGQHVYMSSWAARLAFDVGQLARRYPQIEVPLVLREVSELHSSSIHEKYISIPTQNSSNSLHGTLHSGGKSSCTGLPDPV